MFCATDSQESDKLVYYKLRQAHLNDQQPNSKKREVEWGRLGGRGEGGGGNVSCLDVLKGQHCQE